jgi:uracil-DNA glycosylase
MQRRISAFFGPNVPPAKRAKPSPPASEPDGLAAAPATAAPLSGAPLPSDVAARVAANRAAALARLAARGAAAAPALAALEPSWRAALAGTLAEPFWPQLAAFVEARRAAARVYPPPEALFSAFNYSSFTRTRVVIIGQDPYHGPRQAHGMAFSVARGVPIPPSLRNMYKELAEDVEGWAVPRHGNLEPWARQGVLLLNAVLTVEDGRPNSHKGRGWERFTDAVVAAINKREGKGVVFLLWGSYAKAKGEGINKRKHSVMHAPHPSPLSASRGFFGCKHFSAANAYLVRTGQEPIDWTLPTQ